MRLIDADKLIESIENSWDWSTINSITARTVLMQTIRDIKNEPTVDAIPRKQLDKTIEDIKHSDIHGIARPGYMNGFSDGLRTSIKAIHKNCYGESV